MIPANYYELLLFYDDIDLLTSLTCVGVLPTVLDPIAS